MTTLTSETTQQVHMHDVVLYQGDNLHVLKHWISSESVDLVYMDPPFNSGRRRVAEAGLGGPIREFNDNFDSIETYVDWMRPRLSECVRALKPGGAFFLHCDWRSSHYLRVELDRLLGYGNLVNEIVWRRHTSHNDSSQGTRHFGRNADVILFYGKGARTLWNPVFRPYTAEYIERVYRHVEPETGRRYALSDLSGPGGAANGNPVFAFMGHTRAWRYSREAMQQLQRRGQIVRTRITGVPRRKRYLDEMPGLPVQAIWDDLPCLSPQEREHYPTQKPVALLDRIIRSSTKAGDRFLDPFCGSGTSIVAAVALKRYAIGIDDSSEAIAITQRRVSETTAQSAD